ncbi:MAG: 1,4-dihydroxy-2-naphthoate octaprenyltransferase [Bacteroidales bacterium]|nr:1,4-dihydroxy-2-naphthoate octaprenyltransferase [Bacteroidales bacterium]
MTKALIKSMRLRTLPLSLAGVVCGGLLAMGQNGGTWWIFVLVLLTACLLQILSNLSNEMGDHLSGVDGESREGPNYGMTDGGLTVKQMWRAINGTVIVCSVSGFAMVWVSYSPWWVLLVGVAAIWAATHYTLGKNPYGYKGLGDLFVFIFFGLVSVLGSYYVIAHAIPFESWLICPAVGVGLLSVAVLNVNNIRDMASDEGLRKTIPLRIGEKLARWYQTALIVGGSALLCTPHFRWWLSFAIGGIAVHLWMVWTRKGKSLDPALPILVISTFLLALLYAL